MKTLFVTLAVVFAASNLEIDQLGIGQKAPKTELKMQDISRKAFSLADLKQENGICVIFSCNTCPYVIGWEDRYNEIYEACKKDGIGFVLVNSNEAKRNGEDSMAKMQEHAKEKGYAQFAYVVDENSVLADAFGATKTPDVFLFNGNMELVYKGAMDDNMKDRAAVAEPYLKNALEALTAGKAIDPAETKAIGCSIKRNS